jgi:hypothetical protein
MVYVSLYRFLSVKLGALILLLRSKANGVMSQIPH